MDVLCLQVLRKAKNRRFDSCSVRNSVLIISHTTFQDCRMHISSDNLSQNGCIQLTANDDLLIVAGKCFIMYTYQIVC